jgi:hypothetical protein
LPVTARRRVLTDNRYQGDGGIGGVVVDEEVEG